MYAYSLGMSPYTIQPGDPQAGQFIGMPFVQQPMPVPDLGSFGAAPRLHGPAGISKAETTLRNLWRTLWEQHVAWTRMLIISIAHSLPDEALVTKRLLRNPSDMAAVIKHFYGNERASKFSSLMTDHLAIAAQLVKAAKAGDQAATADAEKRWYANADEIADFLSSINPN
jgi:hypothetical protein